MRRFDNPKNEQESKKGRKKFVYFHVSLLHSILHTLIMLKKCLITNKKYILGPHFLK